MTFKWQMLTIQWPTHSASVLSIVWWLHPIIEQLVHVIIWMRFSSTRYIWLRVTRVVHWNRLFTKYSWRQDTWGPSECCLNSQPLFLLVLGVTELTGTRLDKGWINRSSLWRLSQSVELLFGFGTKRRFSKWRWWCSLTRSTVSSKKWLVR
jgi:hypothetical protein